MKHIASQMKIAGLVSGALISSAIFAVGASDTTTQSVTMSVDEMAVIDVTGSPDTLTIAAPLSGGDTPADATDNSTYAQYTSTVAASQVRKITAQLGTGETAPGGTALLLEATPGAGEGASGGQVTLVADSAKDIITGIGSVATGTGLTDGAQLAYTLDVTDVTGLVAGQSESATVTLTLTEAAAS